MKRRYLATRRPHPPRSESVGLLALIGFGFTWILAAFILDAIL